MRRILIAFAMVLASSVQLTFADDASAVQKVIGGQIASFQAKDHGGAFSYAAPNIRLMFRDEERFAKMVQRGYMPIYGARDYRFGRMRSGGGSTAYQEVLLTGPAGRSWVALYTLKRGSDGIWKIAGVQLVPGNEQST